MKQKRVAVLRGGPSSEYDISMITGSGVLTALNETGYRARDIIVSKTGQWHDSGLVRSPEAALRDIDVVFIAMHGAYGEDGTIQRICEQLHIPFTGSNSLPSKLAFNKDATKRSLRDTSLTFPRHMRIHAEQSPQLDSIIEAVQRAFGPSYVIKPLTSGSSHGVTMAQSDNLHEHVSKHLTLYDECMVEERIHGIEATCGVLEHFRNERYYVLPPVEIIPPDHRDFFAADVKYDGSTTEICPARFSLPLREKIADAARLVHQSLGLSQYSRSDFMIDGDTVYFLEVNTLPGLTPESLFPKAAAAVGLSFPQLIAHLVETARVK